MIVPITLDKIEILQDIARQTFEETFPHYDIEDINHYFDNNMSLDTLKKELLNPESQHFFILVDGKEVGFLKVNVGLAQTEHKLENAFEVQRIYVLQKYHNLGLGRKLFEYAIKLAQQTDLTWMWLGVWEHNYKAQNFYKKFGFERFSEHKFATGSKIETDYLLCKKIK